METTAPISKNTIIAIFEIILKGQNINPENLAIGTVTNNLLDDIIPSSAQKCYCYPEDAKEIVQYFNERWGITISQHHTGHGNLVVFYRTMEDVA